MSNKRFKQVGVCFIDKFDTKISYCCANEIDCKNIVDKLNNLNNENEQLKKENEFAKLLANHRGGVVTFANRLIQDIDDELTQKMWYQFKEEMYQEWKKKRGI